jgi:hypothetical protein
MSLLKTLAEERYQLTRKQNDIKERLDVIGEEMKELMDVGEIAIGQSGIGFVLSETRKRTYGETPLKMLQTRNLLYYFAVISAPKLDQLVKEGRMTRSFRAELELYATEEVVLTLRQKVIAEMEEQQNGH